MHDSFDAMKEILATPVQKGKEVWIADTARVFGKCELGDNCSVWFGAVLRGDTELIRLGYRSNVQDNAVLHTDYGFPLIAGHDVIIGHGAIVHGAQLGNHVLVGMHAVVLNGAQVGDYCIIGANALVTEGMIIPEKSLVLGTPAKVVRQLEEKDFERIRKNADNYVRLAKQYLEHW